MNNPQEAAKMLIEDARAAGRDIDHYDSQEFELKPLRFGNGKPIPINDKASAFGELTDLYGTAPSDSELVCVVQFLRHMSIRESADLLMMGVKSCGHVSGNGIIFLMPVSSIEELLQQPYIRWAGLFKPNYKYVPDIAYHDGEFVVVSIVEDDGGFRNDLESAGATATKWIGGKRCVIDIPADIV
ncbi:MAG: hypothetical protein GY771_12260, partial [bacterium]|nr:hypothetical protein [bacterium]